MPEISAPGPDALKTDFGPTGPQPGTAAYTAFVMAQIFPTNEEEGIYDGFWDDFKEELPKNMENLRDFIPMSDLVTCGQVLARFF